MKSFDSAQLASECFGGEMTVRSKKRATRARASLHASLTSLFFSTFQTKTYDSVTDKFMDFSFEKVRTASALRSGCAVSVVTRFFFL